MLPPLMFSEEEIEALVLGTRWVAKRADAKLGSAAHEALQKIAAVLPRDLRDTLDASALLIGPGPGIAAGSIELAQRLVLGLFPAAESTEAVDARLEQNGDAPGALRRLVIESRDDLARDLRVRAAQSGL